MSIFKRTQRKYVKKAYRVRNWREYEAGLRNRGSLTVWISLTAGKLVNWDAPRPRRRQPGRQRKYSNHAIETAVTLGMVFHLSSRQSEGLLRSLFALMKLDNDVPVHTTISRRKPKLGKVPFYQVKQKTPLHILIDSSGLAVHAGQLRRAQKSRDYRKLHLCVDEQSGEVVAGELTSKRARDSSRVASLVGQSDSPRLVKILERPAVQQFAPLQRLLEFAVVVGYVFQLSGRSRDGLEDHAELHLRVRG